MGKFAPVWYNPYNHRDEFVTSFDRLFDNLVKSSMPELQKSFGVDFFEKSSYPKMNVAVTSKGVEIVTEIPGLTKDDVRIKFADNVLTISGEKQIESETDEVRTYVLKELKHSSFSRSLKFHHPIVTSEISAKFENGVLQIFAPWETPKDSPKEFEIAIN